MWRSQLFYRLNNLKISEENLFFRYYVFPSIELINEFKLLAKNNILLINNFFIKYIIIFITININYCHYSYSTRKNEHRIIL